MNIREKIQEIFLEASGVNPDKVHMDSLLKYDLVITSICYIKIITKLEDEFGIEFESRELELTDDMTYADFLNRIETVIKKML